LIKTAENPHCGLELVCLVYVIFDQFCVLKQSGAQIPKLTDVRECQKSLVGKRNALQAAAIEISDELAENASIVRLTQLEEELRKSVGDENGDNGARLFQQLRIVLHRFAPDEKIEYAKLIKDDVDQTDELEAAVGILRGLDQYMKQAELKEARAAKSKPKAKEPKPKAEAKAKAEPAAAAEAVMGAEAEAAKLLDV
jgi:hypothetical protein